MQRITRIWMYACNNGRLRDEAEREAESWAWGLSDNCSKNRQQQPGMYYKSCGMQWQQRTDGQVLGQSTAGVMAAAYSQLYEFSMRRAGWRATHIRVVVVWVCAFISLPWLSCHILYDNMKISQSGLPTAMHRERNPLVAIADCCRQTVSCCGRPHDVLTGGWGWLTDWLPQWRWMLMTVLLKCYGALYLCYYYCAAASLCPARQCFAKMLLKRNSRKRCDNVIMQQILLLSTVVAKIKW